MRDNDVRDLEEKLREIDNRPKRRTRVEYQEERRNGVNGNSSVKKNIKKEYDDLGVSEMKKRKNNRKPSFHKIFNIISFIFLLTCVLVYGIRFLFLYIDNNKTEKTKLIADNIKDDNAGKDYFKNISGDYYFSGSEVNNYISYSNMLWRIIKIDSSGNVVIVLDKPITSLSKGNGQFKGSNIASWLNSYDEDNTGYFQRLLNDVPQFLTYTKSCIDDDKDIKNISCKKRISKTYVTIPSLNDYVNTGGSKSFLNIGSYYYLINNDGNKTWCVDNEGKISTSDGNDIIGVRPVVTIKSLTKLKSGKGSEAEPYVFEEEVSSFIGSYVKLGDDVWQVYDEDENNVRLSLDGYITYNQEEVLNKYSRIGYKFDISESGSLAWYLNNRYFNNLKYNKILEEFEISNGVYKGDFKETIKDKVKTRVGILSLGDVIINSDGSEYYLSTGSSDEKLMYISAGAGRISTKSSSSLLRILPTISIKKSLLLEHGTKEKPYEVIYEN